MKSTEFNPDGNLTIVQLLAWMDGGSVTLDTEDESSNSFTIEFTQHAFLRVDVNSLIPGSIFINRELVEVRSTLEHKIINALKSAKFKQEEHNEPDSLEMGLLWECIHFTESEDYVALAKKFNRI